MVDRLRRTEHPILSGLAALVGVGLVVGLVLGFAALAGARVFGLDGGSETAQTVSDQSMYLPRPEKTQAPSGPLITLAPGSGSSTSPSPSDKPSKSKSPAPKISLSASQTAVAPMDQIDLTGVYPGGEGSILQVQQFSNGGWDDFPVTASVSNQTFRTFIQTGQPGVNRFRMVDTDTGLTSNEIKVTVSGG